MNFNIFSRSTEKLGSACFITIRRQIHLNPAKQPAKLLIFPINKKKSYVHFEYSDDLINTNSPFVKYEDKLIKLASKGWKNISESEKSYNKKIVYYINKLLESTPWSENSLRSIPSTSALLRQIQIKNDKEATNEIVLKNSIELETSKTSSNEKVLDIPVYYPSSLLTTEQLQNELLQLAQHGKKYHQRHMLINAFLIPFTIPFAIVPIVPNIPGFYLAYRFYCNFKAFLGAGHLQELIKQDQLNFIESKDIDLIYSETNSIDLLNDNGINKIIDNFNILPLKGVLSKALKQETEATSSSKN